MSISTLIFFAEADKNFLKKVKIGIDKCFFVCYTNQAVARTRRRYGGIAQLARAIGSYPIGRGFKSNFRYQ